MATMDSTKSRPWLVARVRAPLAIGSCTLVIICQVVVPADWAASMVVGETLRMPSATSLIAAGAAFHYPPGTVHRVTAIEDTTILEVSTPHLDDVVRLEDAYGREGTSAA